MLGRRVREAGFDHLDCTVCFEGGGGRESMEDNDVYIQQYNDWIFVTGM